MKNSVWVIFLAPFFSLSLSLSGQEFSETRTEHYLVRSAFSPEYSAETARRMEDLFLAFTDLTGQPDMEIPHMVLSEFSTRKDLYSYLGDLRGERQGSFFLIRPGTSAGSEIAFYRDPDRDSEGALIELAFFQFAEFCSSDTPFWIKAGLALYFEPLTGLSYGETPPLNWNALSEWKGMGEMDRTSYSQLLNLRGEEGEIGRNEHLQAWGLVSYLLNSQGKEGRIFWETLALMRAGEHDGWPVNPAPDLETRVADYLNGLVPPESEGEILNRLYQTASYDEIIQYIEKNSLDRDWNGLFYKGLVYYERGLFKDSLILFEASESAGAPLAEVLYTQALCRLQTGDREGAILLLKRVRVIREDLITGDLSRLLE